MTLSRTLGAALLPIMISACSLQAEQPAPASAATSPAALQQMFEAYWQESLALRPLQATSIGDSRYNDQLPNTLGAEYRAQEHAFTSRWLARINTVDTGALDAQDRISASIFKLNLQRELESERFPDYLIPINQFYNLASTFVQLGTGTGAQPFKTVQDYDNWLARASRIPVLFDQAIANMQDGVAKGYVQPTVLMTKAIAQLDAIVVATPEQSLFWKPVTAMPANFSEADRQRLTASYRSLISSTLTPAYAKLRDYLRNDYLPKTRASVGLDALPDGAAWYAFRVKAITTTNLTPAQIHELGLREVARIQGEMQAVMKQVGFTGDLKAFFAYTNSDPRFTYASEDAMLADYNAFYQRVQLGVPKLFAIQPKAAFEIRPVEAFRAQAQAAGSYQRPSEDGTRPGIFYLNTYDVPSRKSWSKESLFLHEAIPGHHFQIGIQQELQGVPAFRRFGGFTAFTEGWGLYAESLGKELGVYTDPYQYYGRLQAELWRAVRLVVDTGLHAKGWTRQQVIDYMLNTAGTSETNAIAEAERYMAIPGQALAYKIGELAILEQRAKAEKALGPKFDIRAFHTEVLKDGAVPMDVLADKIDRWIAVQAAR